MSNKGGKVFLVSVADGYDAAIRVALHELGAAMVVGRGVRICLKPNLTFPVYREGVMTNPEAVESLVRALKEHTDHITICESDSGGYNRFSMSKVFDATGISAMAKRYGVRTVNLSHEPSRPIDVVVQGRTIKVPLPTLLLGEMDLFATMPVAKLQMNTDVNFSLKN